MENLKVVKLTASNVKRLHAVEITPEGSTVIVGGKNGQGKSSVLDSISYALGGKALIPSEPIRKGQKAADIKIDLGDIIVTRRFRRDPLECDCGVHDGGAIVTLEHSKTCASRKFGETRSSLVVTTREGLEYPSPQAVLNKLLGQLTFDPLAFVNADSTKQVETLRSVVKLDLSSLDEERNSAYSERTVLNRQLANETVKFDAMPFYKADGFTITPMKVINDELDAARTLRTAYDTVKREFDDLTADASATRRTMEHRQSKIDELKSQLQTLEQAQADDDSSLTVIQNKIKIAEKKCDKAHGRIPDITSIQLKLAELTEKNDRVLKNIERKTKEENLAVLARQVKDKTEQIEVIDDTKRKMIESVQYPVDGLGFDFEKDEVMFNGVPFNQASKAEQIRVSVAIGLAINPKLRVLLVKDGSALDSEGMRLIAKLAEDANAQFWIERVAESKDGAMVMIEDGEVV